jgi:hypothetical protein
MNDRSDSDLDQAREAIDALAQHVDTTAAWNAVDAAVEHLPRARARHRLQLAATLLSVIAMIGAVAYAVNSRAGKSAVEVTEPSTTTAAPADCALPALPVPGAADAAPSPSGLSLDGPAVSALKGGAALAPFELDGGQLTVTPPRPGDTPTVSANEAECAALASISPNGMSLLDLASSYGGAAVGYGRVSVDPTLVADAQKAPSLAGQTNNDTHPTLPDAAPYQQRLAWLVVVRAVEIVNWPPGGVPPTIPASSHGYLVFLIDAQTGSDALLYAERQYGPAAVTVPAERVSVPWTLVSRSPDGYSGTISATVLPCDGYPNPVNVDRNRAAVSVVVERPVNPTCGDPKQVTILLRAASVTTDLPAEIAHDQLGPDVAIESPNVVTTPGDTGGVLRTLSDQDNGRTIEISVDSVLAVGPLHVSNHYAADLATSSDTDVLGVLDGWSDYEIGEFRAWHTGHADLVVPADACTDHPAPSCTPPLWVVHVNITP